MLVGPVRSVRELRPSGGANGVQLVPAWALRHSIRLPLPYPRHQQVASTHVCLWGEPHSALFGDVSPEVVSAEAPQAKGETSQERGKHGPQYTEEIVFFEMQAVNRLELLKISAQRGSDS